MTTKGFGRAKQSFAVLTAGLAVGLMLSTAAHADAFSGGLKSFKAYGVSKIDAALAAAKELKAKVAAKDTAGAQAAWKKARVGWEGAEIFTGEFFSELDEQIDAWPDAKSGFHAIEAPLFSGKLDEIGPQVDQLVANLQEFDDKLKAKDFQFTAQGLMNGTAGLAYEVGENKSKGGESQFAGTSLTDIKNNLIGIDAAFDNVFEAPLKAKDAKLAKKLEGKIDGLVAMVKKTADFKHLDQEKLRTGGEELAVDFQAAAEKLGLEKPKLGD
jgi:iron uptake system EfeUOB component EfeO/EfeM